MQKGEIEGWATQEDGTRIKLSKDECRQMLVEIEAEDKRRKLNIPDEATALRVMMDAFTRLRDMGWREAIYCPKDGSVFEVIEVGSTGIFKCHYEGEWPKGSWWIHDCGDLWPSRPTLWRPIKVMEPVVPEPHTSKQEGEGDE